VRREKRNLDSVVMCTFELQFQTITRYLIRYHCPSASVSTKLVVPTVNHDDQSSLTTMLLGFFPQRIGYGMRVICPAQPTPTVGSTSYQQLISATAHHVNWVMKEHREV
jgi:hypothetical protein